MTKGKVKWFNGKKGFGFILAFVYEKVGRDVEAIETLNRCLTIRSKHTLARKSLERLTKKNSGACDHALRAADKAVSQNDTTTAMQYLAKAYQLMPDGVWTPF